MSLQYCRSNASVVVSIGTPFHSISAAAFMKRPRSSARGKSICGSMAGSKRSSASTSDPQYRQECCAILRGPGTTGQYQRTKILLFAGVDTVQPEIGKGT